MPERLLLCTDLDRTLLPNGPQPESPGARRRFAAFAADSAVVLAYVTGRHRALVEQAVAEYGLPQPDFVIGDVGTSLYRVGAGARWQRVEAWDRAIGEDWQGCSWREVGELLEDIDTLQLQEVERQGLHKLSYSLPQAADRGAIAAAVSRRLQARGLNAQLVWSIDDLAGVGLLDVLPARAGKYRAVAALQDMQGFGDENTVFSGDSGNDLEVLASPVPAVLVANATAAVRREALRLAGAAGLEHRLYLAVGGFAGMNGNYSAGILEGIAHYHPALADRMTAGGTDD